MSERSLWQVQIAPSILAADFGGVASAAREAEAGGADALHVDVMDGHFVPEISFGRRMVQALRSATRLPLDVHLMVANPAAHIQPMVDAGADAVTVHAESARDEDELRRLVHAVRAAGARAGVALKPATSFDCLESVLGALQQVLVMTVEPGYSGQPFLEAMLSKIEAVSLRVRGTGVIVAVDGGIDSTTAPGCLEAGARFFVAGSSVYRTDHPVRDGIEELRRALS